MTDQALEISAPVRPASGARIHRTHAQWKSLVDDFTASGLTRTAFCQKRGIATSGLYRWQRVLESRSASADFIDITGPVVSAPPAPPRTDGNAHWQVELELGAGIVLRVRTR